MAKDMNTLEIGDTFYSTDYLGDVAEEYIHVIRKYTVSAYIDLGEYRQYHAVDCPHNFTRRYMFTTAEECKQNIIEREDENIELAQSDIAYSMRLKETIKIIDD